jgi:hypothetical protein
MKQATFIICFMVLLATNLFAQTLKQTYLIKTPDHTINKLSSEKHSIQIDGYYTNSIPGYPGLPVKKIRIAVHPDMDMNSVQLHYEKNEVSKLGLYHISASPELKTWRNIEQSNHTAMDIFSTNAFFPAEYVRLSNISQLRKWKIVTFTYSPFQYNPVSKILRMVHSVKLTLSYQMDSINSKSSNFMHDTVMDNRVKNMIENYQDAQKWYGVVKKINRSSVYDYVIITTNKIVSMSAKLDDFISHLKIRKFNPRIVTEKDFSHLNGQEPNGRAEKIRKWLKDHYLEYGIKYVLLIGNPDPDNIRISDDPVGDIPMKMCWPRKKSPKDDKEAATDYYYADLTGNWDLNGDGYSGDFYRDRGPGGVDFMNEVYVGRIPVYNNEIATLDQILEKTIKYSIDKNTNWRRRILMPMSFLGRDDDAGKLSEEMIKGYLNDENFDYWRQYMKGSRCDVVNSIYEPEEELLPDLTLNKWASNKYGMVWWSAHGTDTEAQIGFHKGFKNCTHGNFITSSHTIQLNDNYPAFVYQGSCENGKPETLNNLQFALLKHGAIATYAASRVSYGIISLFWSPDLIYSCDTMSIGYYLGKNLVTQNMEAGESLYRVKSEMGENMTEEIKEGRDWMNLFSINLLGDPSIPLFSKIDHLVPLVQSKPATNISCHSAILKGSINTNLNALEYFFEYGETQSYGSHSETFFLDADIGTTDVKIQVYNLLPDTQYFYRIVVKYNNKTIRSEPASFLTIKPLFHTTFPERITIPVNNILDKTFDIKNIGCGDLFVKVKVTFNDLRQEKRNNQIAQFVKKMNQVQKDIPNVSTSVNLKEDSLITQNSNLTHPQAGTISLKNSSDLYVCVMGSDQGTDDLKFIAQNISKTGLFKNVTYMNVSTFTPKLSELQIFDALLIFSNKKYRDPYTLGNNVADYVEGGGGVVLMMFEIERQGNFGLQGRFEEQKYLTIPRAVPCSRSPRLSMGKIYDPTHPIMNNVKSFDGGIASIRPGTNKVYSDARRIADWEDGKPLVTAKILDCARRADLAFFPKSSEIYSDGWHPQTDGYLLMANALYWASNYQDIEWLSIDLENAHIHTQETIKITLSFNASHLKPGEYHAALEISHNADNEVTPYVVPITMFVKSSEIAVIPEKFDLVMENDTEKLALLDILNGSATKLNWNISNVQLVDSMGQDVPERNDYQWIDSNMENGPVYDWKNISSSGQQVEGLRDDNYTGPFRLNFPFHYYGENVRDVYIGSNGFVAFGPVNTYYSSYRNTSIPGNRVPSNIIAWCWSDLYPGGSRVFFQSEQDQAIIQFNDYEQYHTNGTITAQILLNQNGDTLIQYQKIQGGFDIGLNTIGFANKDNSDGLLVSYNQRYLEEKLALKMGRVSSGVRVSPESGTINPNYGTTLQVLFCSYGLDMGVYTGSIKIGFDHKDISFIDIPIHLTIQKRLNVNIESKLYSDRFLQYQFNKTGPFELLSQESVRPNNLITNIHEYNTDPDKMNVSQNLAPYVILTQVPPYQNRVINLKGQIMNIAPADCQIAVYINNNGWINKPDNKNPTVILKDNGKWICDITTAYADHLATDIAIFLLSKAVPIVIMNGAHTFPESFEKKALHKISLKR